MHVFDSVFIMFLYLYALIFANFDHFIYAHRHHLYNSYNWLCKRCFPTPTSHGTGYVRHIVAKLDSVCTRKRFCVFGTLLVSLMLTVLLGKLQYDLCSSFMSLDNNNCFLFFQVMFSRIYDFIESLSKKKHIALVLFVSFVLPTCYVVGTYQEWWNDRTYGSTENGVDVALVALKYHPIAYLHVFICGCCLPKIRLWLSEIPNTLFQRLLPLLSLFGYLSLLLLFFTSADDIPGYKINLRLGLISVFQSIILIGLTLPVDILGYIFSHPLFVRFGDISYPQYVFQFMAYAWYSHLSGEEDCDETYFLLLFVTSVVVSLIVSLLKDGKIYDWFNSIVLVIFLIYLCIQPVLTTLQDRNSSAFTVHHDDIVYIPLISNTIVFEMPFFSPIHSDLYFNPSVVIIDDYPIMSFRKDYITSSEYQWYGDVYLLNKWEPEVYIGNPSFTSRYTNGGNPESIHYAVSKISIVNFKPCISPPICNANGTVTIKMTTGPEDPRLFVFQEHLYMTMFSYDNVYNATLHEANDYKGAWGTGSDLCEPTPDGLIGRMYIMKVEECGEGKAIPVYQDGLQFVENTVVKNWLTFNYYNTEEENEELYFIHQISPSVVIMKTTEITESYVNTSVQYIIDTPAEILSLDSTACGESQMYCPNGTSLLMTRGHHDWGQHPR